MKLEYFRIDPTEEGARVNLGFSTPEKLAPSLVTEIGRRIENFLMPLHAPATEPGWSAKSATVDNRAAYEVIISAEATSAGASPQRVRVTRDLGNGLSSTTLEPVPPIAEAAPAKRTRAAKVAEPEPTPEAAPTTRRTRTPAPAAEPVISDMDLAKAASEAAEIIGVEAVKGIISELGVSTVNQIEGHESRKHFLGLLSLEIKLVKEEQNGADASA